VETILAQKKDSLSRLTLSAIDAALHAGDLLRKGFGTKFSISNKEGRHNLVTEYDTKSEKTIIDFLKSSFPDSYFLAEESGSTGSKTGLLWIIDPLDGTVNFAHGLPNFCVSIAAQFEGEVVSGIVYQPLTQELFVAEKGKGATLNGERIHVSKVQELTSSILSTGFPYNLSQNPFHCIEHFIDILKMGIPIRRLGSAAIDLAYTAAGRLDGFFEVGLQPWDIAAGKLLVEEAGGRVTSWNGKSLDIHTKLPIFASNGLIHEETAAILNRKIV
jgi:myo-inositol-1(or 4)-monophosphatase